MRDSLSNFVPGMTLTPGIALAAVALMIGLGIVTGLVPALNAFRLRHRHRAGERLIMRSLLLQVAAVTMINIKSIPRRFWLSLSTVISIALVVVVLLAFLAMANGFQRTLSGTGSEDIAVVLRGGSRSEINSVVLRDQVRLVEEAPGIARGPDGKPLVSAELYLTIDGIKRSSGTKANLPLRGIGPEGAAIRKDIRLIEGRMFNPGSNELVVGKAILSEFQGFELGSTVVVRLDALDRGRRVRCRRQRVRFGNLGRSRGGAEPVQAPQRRSRRCACAWRTRRRSRRSRATSRTIRDSSSTPNRRPRTTPTSPRSPRI